MPRGRIALASALVTAAFAARAAAPVIYPPDQPLVRVPQPSAPRPGYLVPTAQPEFGTQIRRISDKGAFHQARVQPETVIYLRHAYAKVQPWNADESLIMLSYSYPAAILDGVTYRFLRTIHQPSDAVWSASDPNTTIGTFANTNKLVATDMRTDWTSRVVHQFGEYRRIAFGLGEGNLSADGRWIALFGVKASGGVDLFVYDFQTDTVVARRDLGAATISGAHPSVNNATMSASGAYVVIEYNAPGLGDQSGIVAYDRQLRLARPLAPNAGSHYDVCTDAGGAELIVVQSSGSSALIGVELADATTTPLLPAALMNYSIHVSCRDTARPGWVYISEFAGSPPQADKADYQSAFALALDGSGLVERFAHEHPSASTVYGREPQAAPNHAGDRVIFASDRERAAGPVYDYVAAAR